MAGPATHLVVLVNGLWGFQRDWAQMKKALDAQNDGSYLIHVSAVNTGSQTSEGQANRPMDMLHAHQSRMHAAANHVHVQRLSSSALLCGRD
jgi:hypothetical protein